MSEKQGTVPPLCEGYAWKQLGEDEWRLVVAGVTVRILRRGDGDWFAAAGMNSPNIWCTNEWAASGAEAVEWLRTTMDIEQPLNGSQTFKAICAFRERLKADALLPVLPHIEQLGKKPPEEKEHESLRGVRNQAAVLLLVEMYKQRPDARFDALANDAADLATSLVSALLAYDSHNEEDPAE